MLRRLAVVLIAWAGAAAIAFAVSAWAGEEGPRGPQGPEGPPGEVTQAEGVNPLCQAGIDAYAAAAGNNDLPTMISAREAAEKMMDRYC